MSRELPGTMETNAPRERRSRRRRLIMSPLKPVPFVTTDHLSLARTSSGLHDGRGSSSESRGLSYYSQTQAALGTLSFLTNKCIWIKRLIHIPLNSVSANARMWSKVVSLSPGTPPMARGSKSPILEPRLSPVVVG